MENNGTGRDTVGQLADATRPRPGSSVEQVFKDRYTWQSMLTCLNGDALQWSKASQAQFCNACGCTKEEHASPGGVCRCLPNCFAAELANKGE
eukprot:6059763-Karenia_brevis.AAC.1